MALLTTALLGFSAIAQSNKYSLRGKVSDSNQAMIAGADVSIRNILTGAEFRTQSDSSGEFFFDKIADGNYRLTVTATGFSAAGRDLTIGASDQNIEIKLEVGNISETVSVTAARTELVTSDSAVPVSVLTREQIEQKTVGTIGDVFRDLPGTTTVNEGAFQVRPRIRGLDSNRILILVDGERLNNARTSTSQSGIEIGLVDVEQIETVEVVRGSGSVLYGTDALAGTVNIITREAPRGDSTNKFRFGGTFNGFFNSNDSGRRGSLAVTGSNKWFSFRASQSLERYGNYSSGKLPDGGESEVGNSQSHGGNTQLTTRFFFNENNDLRLSYDRRIGRNIGSPGLTLDAGFNAYFPYSNRDKFSGRYEARNLTPHFAKISASFYFQNQERNFTNRLFVPPVLPFFPGIDNFSETITDTRSYGLDLQTNWLFGTKNFLIAGFSFFRDENQDKRYSEQRIPVVIQDTTQSVPDSDFGSFAAFVQDQYDVAQRLKLIGGLRIERFTSGSSPTAGFALPATLTQSQLEDLNAVGLDQGLSISEFALTGDFGAVFRVTDEISLNGRIGRSFRVANLFERFFTGAGSIGGFVVGNPILDPESGLNLDVGARIQTSKYAGSFTYFNNSYRDFLSNQLAFDRNGVLITIPGAPGRPPTEVYQTVNLGRARIQGFEAEFEMPFKIAGGFLTPGGNISYLRGDDLQAREPLNTITPLKTVLNLRWQDLAANYYADWTTRITNKQKRLSESFLAQNGGAEPGFAVSDIRGGYSFKRDRYRMSFNLGVTNLFDRFYYEQFNFAQSRGRSVVLGTSWELF